MKGFKFCFLFVALTMLYCCTNNVVTEDTPTTYMEFSSRVSGSDKIVTTRKVENDWHNEDKIGLFAFNTGVNYSQASVDPEVNNRAMITKGDGVFRAVIGGLEYPKEGNNQDYIAYFPYMDNTLLQDFVYPVNLSDQKDIDIIDFLVSDNLKNISNSPEKHILKFKHKLSRVTLSISSEDFDLKEATVTAIGLPTKADFNLINGKFLVNYSVKENVNARTIYNGSELIADLLVLADDGVGSLTFVIRLKDGSQYRFVTPTSWKWTSGSRFNQPIKLSKEGGTTDPDPIPTVSYIEYPKIGKLPSTQKLVLHEVNAKLRNFSMLYDTELKFAYWVAYPHHSYYLGSTKRTNAWQYDPYLPREVQANLTKGYPDKSLGLDRGHQIPSGDRTKDRNMNAQTFYYSNMTPQVGRGLNQTVWADLEDQVRDWTKSNGDTVYVVTGAGIYDKNNIKYTVDNSQKPVAMPDYYYKTLLKKVNGQYYTIGFLLENRNLDRDYNKYRKTVKEIEEITGFEFYPGLPDKKVKDVIVNSQWN